MNKFFILGIFFFVVAIIGVAVFISNSNLSQKAEIIKTQSAKISVDHDFKELGNIEYSKGLLLHSFPIKNTGTQDLEIANMTTSCMCTEVFLRKSGENSPSFGMKGMSAPSEWIGILRPGEEAEVVAAFDPTYHGPQGVGKISRIVSFETNVVDNPYVEFSFEGNVVK